MIMPSAGLRCSFVLPVETVGNIEFRFLPSNNSGSPRAPEDLDKFVISRWLVIRKDMVEDSYQSLSNLKYHGEQKSFIIATV